MMTDWYKKSMNALALNGKAGRTQEAYSRALRMLCEFYGNKEPEDISEQELEAYFLRRRNVDHWSANTLRICYCGIRFYFVQVLRRDWNLFNFLRAKSESRLPAVLSREEVRAVLGCVRTPHNRAYLSTVYACGLRLQEALYLEISDIDADRMKLAQGFALRAPQDALPEVSTARATMGCPHCGGRLRWCSVVLPRPLGSRALSSAHAAATKLLGPSTVGGSG